MKLNKEDRENIIMSLFDELTSSSFAEGNEEKIARGLEARNDKELLKLAEEKGTWMPTVL